MADRYLLESGAPDGYLLEDGTGVLILEQQPAAGTPVIAYMDGQWTYPSPPLEVTPRFQPFPFFVSPPAESATRQPIYGFRVPRSV